MKKVFLLLCLPLMLLVIPTVSSCQEEKDAEPAAQPSDPGSSPADPLPTDLVSAWRDSWSVWNGHVIYPDLYNSAKKAWFDGNATPWDLQPDPANGVSFDEKGNFVWVVLSSTRPYPGSGCWVTTAEFIRGKAQVKGNKITFTPAVRRQMYHSVCNPDQNYDREREHTAFEVTYQILSRTEAGGTQLKVIRLVNPDNSFTEYFTR
jgi:hypothetical protein